VQPLRNFPAFYGTRRFITVFTSSPPMVPTCARLTQSTPSHPVSLRSILILSTHLHLGLPSGPFPSGFPTNILYAFLVPGWGKVRSVDCHEQPPCPGIKILNVSANYKTGLTGLLICWTLTLICYCKEHRISETGSVSVLSDYPKRPNSRFCPPFHLGIEMGPIPETLCSLDPLKLRGTACYPGI
jgi:hypothetical protein